MKKSNMGIVALSFLLTSCAHRVDSTWDEKNIGTAFAGGYIQLTCETSACASEAAKDLIGQQELARQGKWPQLAASIAYNNYNENVGYYYLGMSAEGLGKPSLALIYYQRGLSAKNVCQIQSCKNTQDLLAKRIKALSADKSSSQVKISSTSSQPPQAGPMKAAASQPIKLGIEGDTTVLRCSANPPEKGERVVLLKGDSASVTAIPPHYYSRENLKKTSESLESFEYKSIMPPPSDAIERQMNVRHSWKLKRDTLELSLYATMYDSVMKDDMTTRYTYSCRKSQTPSADYQLVDSLQRQDTQKRETERQSEISKQKARNQI